MNDSEMNYIENDVLTTSEVFRIYNDKIADWAVKQIKESEKERDRLIDLANSQIAELEDRIEYLREKCNNDTKLLRSQLAMYFETIEPKETKTQKSYKLLSGTLVFKKPSIKINHDDEKLIKSLYGTEFVEIKKTLKWGEYKKNLIVIGDDVVDQSTGEIMAGCTVEEVPGEFNVKF